jgi:hypothetical protein
VGYINIPWQQEGEGLLEEGAKEVHIDPELGRQLEDVAVDWDTGGKKIIRLCEKHPGTIYQHTMAAGAGTST